MVRTRCSPCCRSPCCPCSPRNPCSVYSPCCPCSPCSPCRPCCPYSPCCRRWRSAAMQAAEGSVCRGCRCRSREVSLLEDAGNWRSCDLSALAAQEGVLCIRFGVGFLRLEAGRERWRGTIGADKRFQRVCMWWWRGGGGGDVASGRGSAGPCSEGGEDAKEEPRAYTYGGGRPPLCRP
eukprot:gene19795-biopygen13054